MLSDIADRFARVKETISFIRLKPFGTATDDERSKERYRRVSLSALTSGCAKGISMLTALISIPLTLDYLGAERYGLWIVLSSTIAMLSFADLGMGNGLINAVSEAHGRNDKELANRYVSSAFLMLTCIALLIGIIFALLYPRVSWTWLLNISSPQARKEAGPAMLVFMACFLINLPLGIVQRVQIGYQDGFFNGLWQAFGNLLALGSVLLAIHFKADLPWMVFAMAGVPVLATAINGIVLFGFQRPWTLPKLKNVSLFAAQRVLKTGFLFLILQIAVALGYQSDNFVISHFLGASYVPQYQVPMKLFMLTPLILGFVLTPLWPAYGEAKARLDVVWIRKTYWLSLKWSLSLDVIAAILLMFFGRAVIHIWVGPSINPPLLLLLGLGLWTALNGLGAPIAVLLNGTNTIGIQVICASVMAVSNILLSIFLVGKIGVAGPIYGTVITWTIFNLIPYMIYIPRMFSSWQLGTHQKSLQIKEANLN